MHNTQKRSVKSKAILTVLVAAYNHEDTIREALDSILKQHTKYSYHILIAEDGSTDTTVDICQEYAEQYPEKITLVAQSHNTKALHLREAVFNIDTKYFCVLEGDDMWCNANKIQKAIETLEEHPEYMTFAHDTIYNDVSAGTKQSLVHDIHKTKIKNPVTFEDAPYFHTSARVHRNTVDLQRAFRNVRLIGDIYLFYIYLNAGPLYYHDKIMSVYRITGKGMWSKLTPKEQLVSMDATHYNSNIALDFERDGFFSVKVSHPKLLNTLKRVLGMRLGWKIYIIMNSVSIKFS